MLPVIALALSTLVLLMLNAGILVRQVLLPIVQAILTLIHTLVSSVVVHCKLYWQQSHLQLCYACGTPQWVANACDTPLDTTSGHFQGTHRHYHPAYRLFAPGPCHLREIPMVNRTHVDDIVAQQPASLSQSEWIVLLTSPWRLHLMKRIYQRFFAFKSAELSTLSPNSTSPLPHITFICSNSTCGEINTEDIASYYPLGDLAELPLSPHGLEHHAPDGDADMTPIPVPAPSIQHAPRSPSAPRLPGTTPHDLPHPPSLCGSCLLNEQIDFVRRRALEAKLLSRPDNGRAPLPVQSGVAQASTKVSPRNRRKFDLCDIDVDDDDDSGSAHPQLSRQNSPTIPGASTNSTPSLCPTCRLNLDRYKHQMTLYMQRISMSQEPPPPRSSSKIGPLSQHTNSQRGQSITAMSNAPYSSHSKDQRPLDSPLNVLEDQLLTLMRKNQSTSHIGPQPERVHDEIGPCSTSHPSFSQGSHLDPPGDQADGMSPLVVDTPPQESKSVGYLPANFALQTYTSCMALLKTAFGPVQFIAPVASEQPAPTSRSDSRYDVSLSQYAISKVACLVVYGCIVPIVTLSLFFHVVVLGVNIACHLVFIAPLWCLTALGLLTATICTTVIYIAGYIILFPVLSMLLSIFQTCQGSRAGHHPRDSEQHSFFQSPQSTPLVFWAHPLLSRIQALVFEGGHVMSVHGRHPADAQLGHHGYTGFNLDADHHHSPNDGIEQGDADSINYHSPFAGALQRVFQPMCLGHQRLSHAVLTPFVWFPFRVLTPFLLDYRDSTLLMCVIHLTIWMASFWAYTSTRLPSTQSLLSVLSVFSTIMMMSYAVFITGTCALHVLQMLIPSVSNAVRILLTAPCVLATQYLRRGLGYVHTRVTAVPSFGTIASNSLARTNPASIDPIHPQDVPHNQQLRSPLAQQSLALPDRCDDNRSTPLLHMVSPSAPAELAPPLLHGAPSSTPNEQIYTSTRPSLPPPPVNYSIPIKSILQQPCLHASNSVRWFLDAMVSFTTSVALVWTPTIYLRLIAVGRNVSLQVIQICRSTVGVVPSLLTWAFGCLTRNGNSGQYRRSASPGSIHMNNPSATSASPSDFQLPHNQDHDDTFQFDDVQDVLPSIAPTMMYPPSTVMAGDGQIPDPFDDAESSGDIGPLSLIRHLSLDSSEQSDHGILHHDQMQQCAQTFLSPSGSSLTLPTSHDTSACFTHEDQAHLDYPLVSDAMTMTDYQTHIYHRQQYQRMAQTPSQPRVVHGYKYSTQSPISTLMADMDHNIASDVTKMTCADTVCNLTRISSLTITSPDDMDDGF